MVYDSWYLWIPRSWWAVIDGLIDLVFDPDKNNFPFYKFQWLTKKIVMAVRVTSKQRFDYRWRYLRRIVFQSNFIIFFLIPVFFICICHKQIEWMKLLKHQNYFQQFKLQNLLTSLLILFLNLFGGQRGLLLVCYLLWKHTTNIFERHMPI